MRVLFLSGILFATNLYAGPNAAVFCAKKTVDGKTTEFSAFDIANTKESVLFKIEGQHHALPEGKTSFLLKDATEFKTEVVSFAEGRVESAYVNATGQRAQISSSDDDGAVLGRIISITYSSDQASRIDTFKPRTGKVTVKLQEGTVDKLEFSNCKYEGGFIEDWKKMWGKE